MSGRILLTGASGVVGSALLDELGDGREVIALVHRNPVPRSSVESVAGDVARPRLGLEPDRYDRLAGEIDLVVHSAAVTSFTEHPDRIVAANVEGTMRVLELAVQAGASVLHVGTAFEQERPGRGGRSGLSAGTDAYRRSKRTAERLVGESGVPYTVVKPSLLIGDSRTGRIAKFQGIHYIIEYIFRGHMPFLPIRPDERIDLIPQDVVARAMADLMQRPCEGETFYLTLGSEALTLRRLVELGSEFSRMTAHPFSPPRFVDPDIVDRLIRPVFMQEFPARIRRRLERLIEFDAFLNPRGDLPTSLPELRRRFDTGHLPAVEDAFVAGLRYWAEENGLLESAHA